MSLKSFGPAVIKFASVSFALGVFFCGQRPVEAQSEGGGALVLHGCPETSTFYGRTDGYIYEVCADIVFTPSGIVNASFHGSLINPAAGPSKTIVARDFPCVYDGVRANESEVVINPDGTVNGFCKLHKE